MTETQRLNELVSLKILDTPPEEVFDRSVRMAAEYFQAPIVKLSFIDEKRQYLKAKIGLSITEIPRGKTFCDTTIEQEGIFSINDTLTDPVFKNNPAVISKPYIRSYCGIPIKSPKGFNVGSLCILDQKPREFNNGQLQFLQDLAAQVEQELIHRYNSNTLKKTYSEARFFQALLQSASEGIVAINQRGIIVTANPRMTDLFGYTLEEFENQNISMLMPKEYADKHDHYLANYLTTSEKKVIGFGREVTGKRKNQTEFPIRLSVGEVIERDERLYIGVITDLSESKRLTSSLAESEHRLRLSQTYANIGTWDWNIKTGELFWSERIAPMFGGYDGSLETSYDNFINAIHIDDRANVIDAIDKAINQEEEYSIEHRVVWKNGNVRWLKEQGGVERDENGEPFRMLGVVQDVTKEKLLNEEIQHARNLAEQANTAKSHFLSSMSHELRTPLNGILGFAQILGSDSQLTKVQTDAASQIEKSGWHLLELINDVLEFSKIESGKINLDIKDVEIVSLIEECIDICKPIAQQFNTKISTNILNELLTVRADQTRIKQCLINLLSNAIKYNKKDGAVLITAAEINSKKIIISVKDNGQGMTKEQLEHLFESFNRLGRENDNIEGTGIGLVITKRLIEAMDGQISVQSEAGSGSTFTIELYSGAKSIQRETETPRPTPVLTKKEQFSTTTTKPKVLYIEDNPVNIKLVERVLKTHANVELLTAHSGSIGYQLATSSAPDIVLLDMSLPDIDGREVFLKLQNNDATKDVPVIAFSADANQESIDDALKLGFKHYLTKPLNISDFLSTLSSLI